MSKFTTFLKRTLVPKLSDNKFFVDKNGKPSSKRLGGLALLGSSILLSLLTGFGFYTIDPTIILGLATIGSGLLGLPKDQISS